MIGLCGCVFCATFPESSEVATIGLGNCGLFKLENGCDIHSLSMSLPCEVFVLSFLNGLFPPLGAPMGGGPAGGGFFSATPSFVFT